MASPHTRQQLIDFALRRLGAPVIEINVDPDQIEDCVDDTLQMFREYHSDGTKRIYLKHQITATDVVNKYIELSSDIQYVSQLLPFNTSTLTGGAGMFSVQYQIHLNDLASMNSFVGNMAYYEQIGQYLETLDTVLNGVPLIHFQRYENRLYIFGEWWDSEVKEGDWVVAEVYQIVDPDNATSIYNNTFIKKYLTAQIKLRWGNNMSKFEGMQLPGGVTISGQRLIDEAKQELQDIEEELHSRYEFPPVFFIG